MFGIAEMFVGINYLAVLTAAVVAMAIGAIWYGPLFGKRWVALSGMTEASLAEAKQKGMGKSYTLAFVGTLVTAFMLANLAGALGKETFVDGFGLGFWLWLGLIAPVTLGSVLWEGKSWKLWVLNNAELLIATIASAIVVTMWQ